MKILVAFIVIFEVLCLSVVSNIYGDSTLDELNSLIEHYGSNKEAMAPQEQLECLNTLMSYNGKAVCETVYVTDVRISPSSAMWDTWGISFSLTPDSATVYGVIFGGPKTSPSLKQVATELKKGQKIYFCGKISSASFNDPIIFTPEEIKPQ